MMKKMMNWMMAAILICGATTVTGSLTSCKKANTQEEQTAAKVVKLGWHHHPVMNYGILVQGELTIIGQDGKEKTVHEGEAVVEMVNTIHHGENRGSKPVILYMFYLSQKDLPLAVQHPEIPLE